MIQNKSSSFIVLWLVFCMTWIDYAKASSVCDGADFCAMLKSQQDNFEKTFPVYHYSNESFYPVIGTVVGVPSNFKGSIYVESMNINSSSVSAQNAPDYPFVAFSYALNQTRLYSKPSSTFYYVVTEQNHLDLEITSQIDLLAYPIELYLQPGIGTILESIEASVYRTETYPIPFVEVFLSSQTFLFEQLFCSYDVQTKKTPAHLDPTSFIEKQVIKFLDQSFAYNASSYSMIKQTTCSFYNSKSSIGINWKLKTVRDLTQNITLFSDLSNHQDFSFAFTFSDVYAHNTLLTLYNVSVGNVFLVQFDLEVSDFIGGFTREQTITINTGNYETNTIMISNNMRLESVTEVMLFDYTNINLIPQPFYDVVYIRGEINHLIEFFDILVSPRVAIFPGYPNTSHNLSTIPMFDVHTCGLVNASGSEYQPYYSQCNEILLHKECFVYNRVRKQRGFTLFNPFREVSMSLTLDTLLLNDLRLNKTSNESFFCVLQMTLTDHNKTSPTYGNEISTYVNLTFFGLTPVDQTPTKQYFNNAIMTPSPEPFYFAGAYLFSLNSSNVLPVFSNTSQTKVNNVNYSQILPYIWRDIGFDVRSLFDTNNSSLYPDPDSKFYDFFPQVSITCDMNNVNSLDLTMNVVGPLTMNQTKNTSTSANETFYGIFFGAEITANNNLFMSVYANYLQMKNEPLICHLHIDTVNQTETITYQFWTPETDFPIVYENNPLMFSYPIKRAIIPQNNIITVIGNKKKTFNSIVEMFPLEVRFFDMIAVIQEYFSVIPPTTWFGRGNFTFGMVTMPGFPIASLFPLLPNKQHLSNYLQQLTGMNASYAMDVAVILHELYVSALDASVSTPPPSPYPTWINTVSITINEGWKIWGIIAIVVSGLAFTFIMAIALSNCRKGNQTEYIPLQTVPN